MGNKCKQWFSKEGNFAYREHLAMSGGICNCHKMCYCHLLGRGQDDAKHLKRHKTAPYNRIIWLSVYIILSLGNLENPMLTVVLEKVEITQDYIRSFIREKNIRENKIEMPEI